MIERMENETNRLLSDAEFITDIESGSLFGESSLVVALRCVYALKKMLFKTVILFYAKKMASTHEYLHKEKCQVDLNDGCTELTEKIA